MRLIKRVISFVLVLGFLLSICASNEESVLSFLESEEIFVASQSGRNQAQDELDDVNDRLDNLEDEQQEIESQLSAKAEELSGLLADKAILESDMAATQAAIEQAEIDLEEAKIQEAKAYEAMKIRIQYMYENSTQDSIWDAILNAKGIADLLNRVEYVSQVHESDRKLLTEYKAVVAEVEMLAADLDASMEEMVALQEIYEHQEAQLESVMAELEAEVDDFESQIAAAEARADELTDYIAEQNRIIAQQQAGNSGSTNSGSSNSGSGNSGNVSTSGGYLTDPSYDPAFITGISGQDVVNYAMQFVGNPYKWGGNSLTNGCDCSGFVNQVYKQFGFSLPRYSQAFKNVGQPVAFANLKAGDIVVYPGHVAIYMGNGCIIEAQSARAGITCSRNVACQTITAIRRIL